MFKLIQQTIEAEHGALNPAQLNQLHNLIERTDFTRLSGSQAVRMITSRYVSELWPSGGVAVRQKKAYICLDSFNRRLDTDAYSWYYSEYRTTAQGFITSTVPLANIKSIKLYQPSIPAYPQLNSMNRVSIYFREFGVYAYQPSNGAPYHYLLRYTPSAASARYVDLNLEEANGGIFTFYKPITKLDTLSVSFGNPSEIILFKNDRDDGVVTGYGAVTTFTMANAHNLQTGDVVYITGFTTGTPGYEAGINTQLGVAITRTGNNTFTIAVNTSSSAVTWISNQPIKCFYAPFRVIIPMEITLE
jgi:hypothetical protein